MASGAAVAGAFGVSSVVVMWRRVGRQVRGKQGQLGTGGQQGAGKVRRQSLQLSRLCIPAVYCGCVSRLCIAAVFRGSVVGAALQLQAAAKGLSNFTPASTSPWPMSSVSSTAQPEMWALARIKASQ